MAIQNFFTSRDNNLDGNTYVGQLGRLWYNPDTNSIYASDGATAGGIPVDLATDANITANNITVNTVTSTSGTVTVSGNLTITGNISPAAAGKIGGITPGPGVNISNTGLLTIDSANLSFSFGNFTANNNILTIVNVDEDMILQTQGDAEIQLIGNIGFYKPDGLPPDVGNRYFRAGTDGQITILVPVEDPIAGGVEIIGSASGNFVTPGVEGTMLQLTGNPGLGCRFYIDAIDNYASIVGRRYNGNVESPTQVLANEYVLRLNATAATDAGVGNVAMAQIQFQALEDQTTTAQGSAINFLTTPIGEPAGNRVEVANITVANGVTATKFTTSGTISATGNVTAGNVNSYVTLPAGTTSKAPLVFTSGQVLSSAAAGAMSYDGRVFYATPQGSERGLIHTGQIFVPNADVALADQTALQSMFGVGTSVSSGTRYAYRILSTIYKSANNISLQYALGGTATLAKHSFQTLTTQTSSLGTPTSPLVYKNILTTGFDTAVTVTTGLNGAGYYTLQINGTINVTTGGTWYPMVGFTASSPGAGSYTAGGSSIEIWPIGPTGTNVSIGAWS